MSEPRINRILKPGDADFSKEMARLKTGLTPDLKKLESMPCAQSHALAINFKEQSLGGNRRLRFAVDPSAERSTKLIFHILNISLNEMEKIGKVLHGFSAEVLAPLPGNVYATAGRNEVYPANWDFIVWGIPNLSASAIQNRIIQLIINTIGDSANG